MRTESIATSLRGGWGLIVRDPIGVLLPAAGLLLLQAAIVIAAQAWWGLMSVWTLVAVLAMLAAARAIIAAPLRASFLAAGARQLARPFSIWARTPGLAVVWIVAGGIELAVVGGALSTALVPAWWLLSRGTYWGAALLLITTAPAILLLGVAARTAFAYVAIEVTVGQLPLARAFSVGMSKASRDWFPLLCILTTGELMIALGSLLCGAGALPGLPFAELALLHRWASMEDAP